MLRPANTTNDPFMILDRAHDDFATAPIAEAFNWAKFAAETDLKAWYLVAFRSTRKLSADVNKLDALDDLAHNDAAGQPGFLFYFKGKILPGTSHLKNLSFCMWQNRDFAKAAAARSMHTNASAIAIEMYKDYKLERYNAHVQRAVGQAWVEFEPVT
jgi:hypothetical protein